MLTIDTQCSEGERSVQNIFELMDKEMFMRTTLDDNIERNCSHVDLSSFSTSRKYIVSFPDNIRHKTRHGASKIRQVIDLEVRIAT